MMRFRYVTYCIVPNVAVEWLALLLGIRDVPRLDLGQKTGYPDRFFVAFLSPCYSVSGDERFLCEI
jgi:hypothetical protein